MPKPSLLLNFLDCWLPISSIPSPADNALTAFGMPLIVGDISVSRGLLPHFSTSSIRTLVRGVYFPAAQFRTSKKKSDPNTILRAMFASPIGYILNKLIAVSIQVHLSLRSRYGATSERSFRPSWDLAGGVVVTKARQENLSGSLR